MDKRINILDHGYLELVEAWGSDKSVICAARMSTDKGFLGWGPKCNRCGIAMVRPESTGIYEAADYEKGEQKTCAHIAGKGDEKLLEYLWKNQHSTPFEMAGMTVEVQAPILVFREWHRHRVPFGYSEMSARYTPLPDLNYLPTVERLMIHSKTNKQAGVIKGAEELTVAHAEMFREQLQTMYVMQEQLYQQALSNGVPKELARVHLPVGRYSRMRATSNLRGWLAFLRLRMARDAQYEIRVYADAVHAVLAEAFPRTLALFDEGMRQ